MANNKITKKTYKEWLQEKGISVRGIKVIGFSFKDESTAKNFHYKLMIAHIRYTMFDSVCNKVVICLPESYVQECKDLAISNNGQEFFPDKML